MRSWLAAQLAVDPPPLRLAIIFDLYSAVDTHHRELQGRRLINRARKDGGTLHHQP